jgi:hypothetical protein
MARSRKTVIDSLKYVSWTLGFTNETEVTLTSKQSHYIEVTQGGIFMEQKMRFGLVLGRLAILKKKLGADYEQLLKGVFFMLSGAKTFFRFKKKIL